MITFKKFPMMVLSTLMMFASTVNAESICQNISDNLCLSGYATYENVIVRPHFTRNNAYFLENPKNIDGQHAYQFKWDYSYNPRIELGFDGFCGAGIRGRYWNFDDNEKIHAKNTDGDIATWFAEDSADDLGFSNSTEAKFSHDMKLHVTDLEVTFDKCDWVFFIGGRYVDMDQVYKAEDLSSTSTVKSKHSFEGWGLTTGLDYLHSFKCDFSLYVKGRASLLYGDSDWKASGDLTTVLSTSSSRDLIPVGELQVGIDWRRCFCDTKVGFIRFGIEAQYWGSAGSAGPGCNAVYDEGNYQNTHPQDSSLGFFGCNLAFGVIF